MLPFQTEIQAIFLNPFNFCKRKFGVVYLHSWAEEENLNKILIKTINMKPAIGDKNIITRIKVIFYLVNS
jgi:hypothetical protein